MLSKLTLIGLHNYSKGAIWGDIDDYIPIGVNKEVMINEILKEDGEFCVIYPDPEFLRIQIKMFFMKYQQMFTKWINVLNEEYDPLFNVDVKTDFTEHGVNEEESASSGVAAGTKSSNGSNQTNSSGSGSSNGNNTEVTDISKAAYDASTLQATERNSSSATTSLTSSDTSSLSSSETASESSSSNNSESMTASQEHTITRNDWKRGNYGTTMSQELLLAEFNARRFNIYNQIADIFAGEFCVTLYV